MTNTIYMVCNLENNKKYIGQTTRDLTIRFQEHCNYKQSSISKLKNSIKKYGKDCFYMEAIWESETCTQLELDEKEIYFIKKYNTLSPNGYNLTEGGAGGRHSSETKKLLSEKSKKMWVENRAEMMEKRREQWTDERKAKLSITLKQRYLDHPEMRIKKTSTSTGCCSSCT
jgi:group I intron endonuclease